MVIFTIEELKETIDLFSSVQIDFFSENCIVAFENNNHTSGCRLQVVGEDSTEFQIKWSRNVNKSGYKESKKITEHAAEAVSFFLSKQFTEYTVLEEATIGTGVDYWLGYDEQHQNFDPRNIFQARLEISGIDKETPSNNLSRRIKEKKTQTAPTDMIKLPAYISVVEFSTPKAFFGKK